MKNAIDILIDKIKKMNNPTVLGLDPRYDMVPECIKSKYEKDFNGTMEAILEFDKRLIDSICDIIPAVKINTAFYEMFGFKGMQVFEEICKYAKEKDMIVIADAKRGDIGTTAQAYSNAFLGETPIANNETYIMGNIDFVTVNPYLGIDGVKPFIEDCKKYNKGIFVLVKTSNPSSGELQDLKLEDGKTIYAKVAELVNFWGEELIGEYGYSSISSVVGATYREQLEELRKIMPHSYFLIPGYGAQGGKAEDIALGFENGIGGIVNSSRGLMCAYKSDRWKEKYSEEQFAEATRAEAIRMREDLNQAIQK